MTKEERWNSMINQPEIKLPEIGSKIYVPTALYIGHGKDDFAGGIATVEKIHTSDSIPTHHTNYYWVTIKERPGTQYNLRYLLENQEEWKKKYKRKKAKPIPDDRMEFNTGW